MAQAQQAGEPNRRQPKNPGPNKFAHTPNTQYGMGDNYGTGTKNKAQLEDSMKQLIKNIKAVHKRLAE